MVKARQQGSVIGTANAEKQSHLVPDSNQNTQMPKIQFTKLSSLSLNTVLLYDWWLVKAEKGEGEGLAVGGFASRESLGVRAFCSAAIAKRHDATSLEAADGIMIKISGFINRSRTHLNGFPLEVCSHFMLGFPCYWEEYAIQCCGQEYADRGIPTRISSFVQVNKSSGSCTNPIEPVSLDDIPVTRIRDILFSPQGDSDNDALERKIFDVLQNFSCNIAADETCNPKKLEVDQLSKDHDDILDAREIRTEGFQIRNQIRMEMNVLSPCKRVDKISLSTFPNAEVRTPRRTEYSVQNETPSYHMKHKVARKHNDDDSEFKISTDFVIPSRSVVTRSMARLKNLGNKQEENLSLRNSVRPKNNALFLTSKSNVIQSIGMVTRSVSRASAVRRSNRLQNRN